MSPHNECLWCVGSVSTIYFSNCIVRMLPFKILFHSLPVSWIFRRVINIDIAVSRSPPPAKLRITRFSASLTIKMTSNVRESVFLILTKRKIILQVWRAIAKYLWELRNILALGSTEQNSVHI